MGAKITTNTSPAVVGEVNGDTFGNTLVTLPTDPEQSGFARHVSEVDAGRVTGAPYLLAGEVSEDFRTRVELDTILDSHVFNETAQSTGKHTLQATVMTVAWSGTALNTNSGNSVAINGGVRICTQQVFPIFGAAETLLYMSVGWTGTWGVTNKTQDIGIFNSSTLNPYAPTDGAYIRVTSAGLIGVCNFNGVELTTGVWKVASGGADFAPVIGTCYDVIVAVGRNRVVFWLDLQDGNGYTRMGHITSNLTGATISQSTAPFCIREAIGGTVASAVSGLKLAHYTISQGGFTNTRAESTTASIITGGQQAQPGSTQGTLAVYPNNTAAGAGAALTNIGAAATGMGGQIEVRPTLAAGTDGILVNYQNPVGTSSINAKTMLITGIKVDGLVTTVLAGGPVSWVVCLNYGHTAVSLATTETAATKQRRVVPIGMLHFPVNAAVGSNSSTGYFSFSRPIPVNPGEHVSISLKNLGTVTTTGVVTCLVCPDWGWVI